ncbi:MAG TPA: phage portal protein [Aggregatilineales bacterium]|nr:phage portal protein [Aggregatilineales bacterium]
MKTFITNGAMKIPLNALPEEAWTYLTGGYSESGDVLELYQQVPWLYQAVAKRANAVASMPLVLLDKNGNEIEQPEKVLPFWETMPDLLDGIEADRTLFGAAYLLKVRNRVKLLGVRRLQPTTVRPLYDDNAGLVGFTRRLNNRELRLDLDDVVYSWLPNRAAEVGPGTSPAAAAMRAAGFLNNMDEAGAGFFARAMMSPIIVTVEDMLSTDAERITKWFERLATGVQNAFRSIGVGGKKIHAERVGHSPGEVDFSGLTASKREDIATALGVPQTLLFSNAANYATAQEDRKAFYDETVVPECEKIAQALNTQLFGPLGYKLKFRPERLEIYQDDKEEEAWQLALMFDRGALTINELRERMGLEPMPGGDETKPSRLALPAPHVVVEGEVEEVSPRDEDMRKFHRFASKRITEGKPEKIDDFESEHIPPLLLATLKGALSAARSVDDVATIFKGAAAWRGYP